MRYLILILALCGLCSGQALDRWGMSQDLTLGAACGSPYSYNLTITNVQRTGATTEAITVANDSFGQVKLHSAQPIIVCGTSDDSASFNTPPHTNEAIVSVVGNVVTITSSSARGANPFASTPDSGTLSLARFRPQKDASNFWWFCDSLDYCGKINSVLIYDFTSTGSGDNGITMNNTLGTKFATGPTANTTLNAISSDAAKMKLMGFNAWGVYVNGNYRGSTTNAGWGGDFHMPQATMLPWAWQFTPTTYAAADLNHDSTVCGLSPHCYSKNSHGNIFRSQTNLSTMNFDRGGLDVFDPNYYDMTSGFVISYLTNDSSVTTQVNDKNTTGWWLLPGDESDTGIDTGASGEFGFGAVAAPKNGLPPTASGNWTNGGDVVNTVASHTDLNVSGSLEILLTQTLMAAHNCNDLRPSGNPCTNVGNGTSVPAGFTVLYNDPLFHTKDQFNCWLQGTCSNEQITNVTAARSGSLVTVTFPAGHTGIGPTHLINIGDVPVLTSCSDSTFNTPAGFQVTVSAISATTAAFTLAGAGTSATGCTWNLGPAYANIAALNTAWGSGYSAFGDSSVTTTNESIGTGTGAQTSFPIALAHCTGYDGDLAVSVAGVLTAGDTADGQKATVFSATNHFGTSEDTSVSAHGTINSSNCTGTLIFAVAPANLAAITGTYSNGGWSHGTKLEDEAGQSAYIGTMELYTLSGFTSAGKTDFDNFQLYVTKQYLGSIKRAVSKAVPGVMFAGMNQLGGFSVSAAPKSIQAFCEYSDVVIVPSIPTIDPSGATSDSQSRADTLSSNCGDKPWIEFYVSTHVSDSAYVNKWSGDSVFTGVGQSGPDFFSGKDIGVYLRDTYMPMLWNTFTVSCGGSCPGTHPFAGLTWLSGPTLRLQWFQSQFFDLYDGKQAILNSSVDNLGNPTGCMAVANVTRCESATSNNMVTPISQAMNSWLNNINRIHVTGAMGGSSH